MRLRIRLAFLAVLLAISPALGQSPTGRREVHTDRPALSGRGAFAPIPPHMHKRNEGGSDGAGLCVICSLWIAGNYHGVPREKLDAMWALAKQRPGGYSPGKLQALLEEVMPEEKWASYVGTDPAMLERLSRMGYAIGATMNTGELYGMRPIHHMVDLIHFDRDQDLAAHVDNNRPGVYSWTTAREYQRRWIDGGVGWAFVWLRKPAALGHAGEVAAVAIVGSIILALGIRRARSAPAPVLDTDPDFDGEYHLDEW